MSRAQGLARLTAFTPAMGGVYAAGRNYDLGPGDRRAVSMLSPFVRRRLVTEDELAAAALAAHGASKAEKFLQEVVWRTYFKGWIEHRPSVWSAYRAGLVQDLDALDGSAERRYTQALEGGTGIDCFDAWSAELRATGYLHNHAHMWFASIWIFTLGLPWRLGADFFLRHLMDGCAASNTLGWRWVAGLHTEGKVYAALSSNIAKYTGGRFPVTPGLAQTPVPLDEGGNPALSPLRPWAQPAPGVGLRVRLIHEDDMAPLDTPAETVITLRLTEQRSPLPVAQAVADADAEALQDAAGRAGGAAAPFATPWVDAGDAAATFATPSVEAFAERLVDMGATELVTAYVPVGWVRDWLDRATPVLAARRIRLTEERRAWDGAFWPHATAGFFKVKKQIPKTLKALSPQALA
ncbi:MAG: FAD-binding domain-containing protein [Pseudomonadota bacterium]